MTDAQMLQNLLAVQETMTINKLYYTLPELKEVIAGLQRRIELEGVKS